MKTTDLKNMLKLTDLHAHTHTQKILLLYVTMKRSSTDRGGFKETTTRTVCSLRARFFRSFSSWLVLEDEGLKTLKSVCCLDIRLAYQ